MAKYYYTSGKRKGKVYQEFYYSLNGEQIVQKKTFYCPVNTKWLSKVEFREYIIQVINDYYPNYLIVDELPEQLDPHIIYFLKQENEDQSIYYDVYVFFEEEMKQIVFKGVDIPELPLIKETINEIISKSLANIYNITLDSNKIISTDNRGYLEASSLSVNDVEDVVSNVSNNSLAYIYNTFLSPNKVVSTDANGYLEASNISVTDANNVISNVPAKSLKNVYNTTLTGYRVVSTDVNGCLEASSLNINDAKTIVSGIANKCLKNIYNTTLGGDKNVVTNSNGYLTTENKPHLYAHHYYYDHGGMGEVNFVIYHSSSSQINNNALGDFLYNLGCNGHWKSYPANGQSYYTGGIVQGVYVQLNSGGLTKYTMYVSSYTIGGNYQEDISNYLNEHWVKIVKIF